MLVFNKLSQYKIINPPEIAMRLSQKGITTFGQLANWLWQLPYGRNNDRSNYLSVIDDKHGTCSTKQGLLKFLAQENNIPIKLMLCTFEMNAKIDERLKPFLKSFDIDSFLECHCYLMFESSRFDITFPHTNPEPFTLNPINEKEISLEEMGDDKVIFHKQAMQSWLKTKCSKETFDSIWKLREDWIKFLGSDSA